VRTECDLKITKANIVPWSQTAPFDGWIATPESSASALKHLHNLSDGAAICTWRSEWLGHLTQPTRKIPHLFEVLACHSSALINSGSNLTFALMKFEIRQFFSEIPIILVKQW